MSFMMGLPSKWNLYGVIASYVMILLGLIGPFGMALFRKIRRNQPRRPKPQFSRFYRGVALMLAMIFIIGIHSIEVMAQGSNLYSSLQNTVENTWGDNNTDIHYTYDNNGSLTKKVTAAKDEANPDTNFTEKVEYTYNLQNRLARSFTDTDPVSTTNVLDVVDYTYNDAGIRVRSYKFKVPENYLNQPDEQTHATNPITTTYLIDAYNPTGYAQVLEEIKDDNSTITRRTYTLGDDVLAQSDTPGTAVATEYLLYDGHGSTRQLTDDSISGAGDIIESYSYDAYGVMLGGNPSLPAATNLLYSGEQFDTDMQQYYLRARYYDQNNGRFNRTDPFSGINQDPQSLHKYLYAHCNPANNIDPSGLFSIAEFAISVAIISLCAGLISGVISHIMGGSFLKAFIKTTMTVAFSLTIALIPGCAFWAYPLGSALSELIWELVVEVEHEPEEIAFRVVFTFITALALGAVLKVVAPAISFNAQDLGAVVAEGGIGPIVKEISTEIGKAIVKGVSFGQVQRFGNLFIDLMIEMSKKESLYKKRYRDIRN